MAAQKVTKISLAEIYKRVPPNQIQKFLHFRDKNAQYKKRVNKYPEFLPKIDWEYYRNNVRTEYIKMVDDFEKKYEELNRVFDCRHQHDTSKYFKEVDEQRIAVKSEVEAYIAESNKRIKAYEAEIERIKSMLPYEQMTCEEFVMACPDKAPLIGCGQEPTFWPHIPEEQTPGPANPQVHEELLKLLESGEPEPEPEPPQKGEPPRSAPPPPGAGGGVTTPPPPHPPPPPPPSSTPTLSAAPTETAITPTEVKEAKAKLKEAKKAKEKINAENIAADALLETAKDITTEMSKKIESDIDEATKLANKNEKIIQAEIESAMQVATPKKQPKKPDSSSPATDGKKPDDSKGKK